MRHPTMTASSKVYTSSRIGGATVQGSTFLSVSRELDEGAEDPGVGPALLDARGHGHALCHPALEDEVE